MKFPTYEEMGKEIAEKALDEYLYKGKTLREWIEIISAEEKQTNTAEWKIVGKTTLHYECSKCGEAGDKWDKYCKHCGRKMTNAVAE